MMRKLIVLALAGLAAYHFYPRGDDGVRTAAGTTTAPLASSDAGRAPRSATHLRGDALADAFENRRSGIPVQGTGSVSRVLADDDDGSRHQRFILTLPSGQTVLIAHNIDLAPRIPALRSGDRIEFSGEYEWNPQGGIVHWTHRDPQGRHAGGWLRHAGRTYQ